MDFYEFYTGKIFEAYDYFGAHIDQSGIIFRTFAPYAQRISVIGDFSNWEDIPMYRLQDRNFFECIISSARVGMHYKYRIYGKDGTCLDHCDPYGFGMELRPNTASIIRDLNAYRFNDHSWMAKRSACHSKPLNIYEIHLGSWQKNVSDENGFFTYRELADKLVRYVTDKGYNYIEFLPLAEHPVDESWGYQGTGFFSPTSRYGTASELMELVDMCHQNNIGVIIDFVPSHFALDDYALARYDGTALYEYPHPDVGNSEWGSLNFIHSRGEVRSFLQSAADFWLTKFHFDGIRLDALSNVVYWQGNAQRGINENAVEFIRVMNEGLKKRHPTALLAAEDSTNFPNVTVPVSEGGLGFDYKWNMGWMNDTLHLFSLPPNERTANYHKLTFSMMYYYNERYLLPFSHDEVVHCKGTIVNRMHGNIDEKFMLVKTLYMYMYAHPGKKLNFMGNEIGQLEEWDENNSIRWNMLMTPRHAEFNRFLLELNQLYLKTPALFENDYSREGFSWLDCHQEDKQIYAFKRMSEEQQIIIILNLSNERHDDFTVEIKKEENATVMFTSDPNRYFQERTLRIMEKTSEGRNTLFISILPHSGLYIGIEH